MVVQNYYPAKILGFITINEITESVIHSSDKPLKWTEAKEKCIVKIILGATLDFSYVTYTHYESFQIQSSLSLALSACTINIAG